MAGVAVIVSRQGTTDWLRSAEHLSLCPEAAELNAHTIGEAVSELKHAEPSSALYLNQANVASAAGVGLRQFEFDDETFAIGSNGKVPCGMGATSSANSLVVATLSGSVYELTIAHADWIQEFIAQGFTFDVLMTGVDSHSQALATAISSYFQPPIEVNPET